MKFFQSIIINLLLATIACVGAYAQINSETPRDINELETLSKEALYTKGKYQLMRELKQILASEASIDIKNRAAVCLAELNLYSQGSLYPTENLLNAAHELIPESDAALKAEAEYLLGILYYIRSQSRTRSAEIERKELIEQGIGSEDEDPFIVKAIQYFDASASYPQNIASVKARIALEALANPDSYQGFQFYLEMGRLFDDNARLNTLHGTRQYMNVIHTYENGAIQNRIDDSSIPEKDRIDIITALSRAYFKLSQYDKALEINQKGIDKFGKIEHAENLKFNRAYIYKYNSRFQEAAEEYDDIRNQFPVEKIVRDVAGIRKARLLIQLDKPDEARTLIDEIIESNSEESEERKADEIIQEIEKNYQQKP